MNATTPSDRSVIRPYRQSDHDALYDICVRTAAVGEDARGLYSTDDLMGDLFAGPYAYLEPDLTFVLAHPDDDRSDGDDRAGGEAGRPVGYVLGTADTERFVEAYQDVWIPLLGDKYPRPPEPPVTAEDEMLAGHFHPEGRLRPELVDHPAHLHIDLLPEYQGRGYGRALMETWLAAAAEAGAPAVFLNVDPANTRARAFYHRLGFRELPVAGGWGLHLVRPTS